MRWGGERGGVKVCRSAGTPAEEHATLRCDTVLQRTP